MNQNKFSCFSRKPSMETQILHSISYTQCKMKKSFRLSQKTCTQGLTKLVRYKIHKQNTRKQV